MQIRRSVMNTLRLSRRAGKTLVQNWNAEPVEYGGQTLGPVSFEVMDD